ncbi:uncharacterized protein SETTUDRAFT_38543 [Exserohilum turcica Et28A]|uniref:Uncharacterized protein n=1 Tax=Exserohilum turcicum (strain 28A) TaxID=671987 RepID=R0IUM7_EXST2|nr:uncharacterized protein SETTUDRAFT_38543 [Exserohilum turcica Et28A]EOA88500.1 hypothetical protein SETTUDRAFT_38543 [Exserohilum turcica Et28A]
MANNTTATSVTAAYSTPKLARLPETQLTSNTEQPHIVVVRRVAHAAHGHNAIFPPIGKLPCWKKRRDFHPQAWMELGLDVRIVSFCPTSSETEVDEEVYKAYAFTYGQALNGAF